METDKEDEIKNEQSTSTTHEQIEEIKSEFNLQMVCTVFRNFGGGVMSHDSWSLTHGVLSSREREFDVFSPFKFWMQQVINVSCKDFMTLFIAMLFPCSEIYLQFMIGTSLVW